MASNTLTGVGAVVPAGTVTGYEIWFVGAEQVPAVPVLKLLTSTLHSVLLVGEFSQLQRVPFLSYSPFPP